MAIKVIEKKNLIDQGEIRDVYNEIECLSEILTGKSKQDRCNQICGYYTHWDDPKRIYIVMENLPLNSLSFHCKKSEETSGPQNLNFVKFYGTEIALGLEFMHSRKVVHRDLKLDNVCIDKNGHAKLIDFGLVGVNIDEKNLCKSFAGTEVQLAPEQICSDKHASKKLGQKQTQYGTPVDWWALGCIIYEMHTGFHVFNDSMKTRMSLYKAIIKGWPENLNKDIKLDPEVAQVVGNNTKGDRFLIDCDPEKRLSWKTSYVPTENNDFFISGKMLITESIPPLIPKYIVTDEILTYGVKQTNYQISESENIYNDGGDQDKGHKIIKDYAKVDGLTFAEQQLFDNFDE